MPSVKSFSAYNGGQLYDNVWNLGFSITIYNDLDITLELHLGMDGYGPAYHTIGPKSSSTKKVSWSVNTGGKSSVTFTCYAKALNYDWSYSKTVTFDTSVPPPPPPRQAKITLNADKTSINLGETVTFYGNYSVSTDGGITWTPIPNSAMYLYPYPQTTGTELAKAVTDSRGDYSMTYTFTSSGNFTLWVVSGEDKSNTVTISVGVPPPPPKATLNIDTTPVKGNVYLNGNLLGLAPQIIQVDPGTYTISFGDVSGYIKPVDQTVTVSAGETKTIIGTYTPTSPTKADTEIALVIYSDAYYDTPFWKKPILQPGISFTFYGELRYKGGAGIEYEKLKFYIDGIPWFTQLTHEATPPPAGWFSIEAYSPKDVFYNPGITVAINYDSPSTHSPGNIREITFRPVIKREVTATKDYGVWVGYPHPQSPFTKITSPIIDICIRFFYYLENLPLKRVYFPSFTYNVYYSEVPFTVAFEGSASLNPSSTTANLIMPLALAPNLYDKGKECLRLEMYGKIGVTQINDDGSEYFLGYAEWKELFDFSILMGARLVNLENTKSVRFKFSFPGCSIIREAYKLNFPPGEVTTDPIPVEYTPPTPTKVNIQVCVVDVDAETLIDGATVKVDTLTKTTVGGWAYFKDLEPKKYRVEASKDGYITNYQDVYATEAGKTYTVTIGLEKIGQALSKIISVDYPLEAPSKVQVDVKARIKNIGDKAGSIWAKLLDVDTYETLATIETKLNAGEEAIYHLVFVMPNKDMNLIVQCGRETIVDDSYSFSIKYNPEAPPPPPPPPSGGEITPIVTKAFPWLLLLGGLLALFLLTRGKK
jgi:hypothetical protein